MKKTISIIFILFMAVFALISCNENGVQHPIVGHNFASSDGSINWYFASDNTARNTIKKNGNTTILDDFTYKIISNQVEIYFGYTDYWKETSKGKLFVTFSYEPENKTLYSVDYGTLHYVN